MQIPKELNEPFEYSWRLVVVLIIIIFFVIGIMLFYKYIYPKIKKIYKKAHVPSLKTRYIEKLLKLLRDIEEKKVDIRNGYFILSNIIRDFIKKTTDLNVLNMSKQEIQDSNIPNLGELMEEYYPPEFSKNTMGDIKESINKTMEVIKRWN